MSWCPTIINPDPGVSPQFLVPSRSALMYFDELEHRIITYYRERAVSEHFNVWPSNCPVCGCGLLNSPHHFRCPTTPGGMTSFYHEGRCSALTKTACAHCGLGLVLEFTIKLAESAQGDSRIRRCFIDSYAESRRELDGFTQRLIISSGVWLAKCRANTNCDRITPVYAAPNSHKLRILTGLLKVRDKSALEPFREEHAYVALRGEPHSQAQADVIRAAES